LKPALHFRTLIVSSRAAAPRLANVALGRVDAPAAHLRPGDVAPDFSLKASDGRVYKLSDFRGRRPVRELGIS
jgi:hypothetical protein